MRVETLNTDKDIYTYMRLEKTTAHAYPNVISSLSQEPEEGSRIGGMRERLGVVVRSDNPRTRMIMRPGINWAFGLQECFAYWNGLNPGYVERYNSQMEEYIQDDGEMLGSAYGRYLRHLPHDQLRRVIDQLSESPRTRRAVINIHNAKYEDYDSNDVACTVYLQFILRDGELNCITSMRSQDMLFGYPYDTNAFQWIQEVVAGILDVDLGFYEHRMNSCHYYTDFEEQVVESAGACSAYTLDDCRLSRSDVDDVMEILREGLRKCRIGVRPTEQLAKLTKYGTYYRDWLTTMYAYEQQRFHDDDVDVDIVTQPLRHFVEFS